MAKRKFNKEERSAIIQKLKNIADEREQASWEECRKTYQPSKTYIKAESLLTVRNEACAALRNLDTNVFEHVWDTFDNVDIKRYLDRIRDKEIEPLVKRYRVNRIDLDVEIILMNQDEPLDNLIEKLLETCVWK